MDIVTPPASPGDTRTHLTPGPTACESVVLARRELARTYPDGVLPRADRPAPALEDADRAEADFEAWLDGEFAALRAEARGLRREVAALAVELLDAVTRLTAVEAGTRLETGVPL